MSDLNSEKLQILINTFKKELKIYGEINARQDLRNIQLKEISNDRLRNHIISYQREVNLYREIISCQTRMICELKIEIDKELEKLYLKIQKN